MIFCKFLTLVNAASESPASFAPRAPHPAEPVPDAAVVWVPHRCAGNSVRPADSL